VSGTVQRSEADLTFAKAGGVPTALPVVPTKDPAWLLVEEGFTLAREHEVESLCAVANGYSGTRGALAEGSSLSAPATFVAGVFIDTPAHLPQLAVLPDWMRVRARIDGSELRLESGEILEHRRILDLRQGLLWRVWRQQQANGRITRIWGVRLASLADRHLLLQSVLLMPENYSALLVVDTGTGGMAGSDRMPGENFSLAQLDGGSVVTAVIPTRSGEILVSFAVATKWPVPVPVRQHTMNAQTGQFLEQVEIPVEIGSVYRMDRFVCVYSTRDGTDPVRMAAKGLSMAVEVGMEQCLKEHVRAWQSRWRDADIVLEGDDAVQRALRLAGYHLISAANPEDERVSIGARSLSGKAYGGHVFWDTEIFMLPFYTFTHPPSARALLMYRYHTLPAARAKARRMGYRGALFPWESAADGEEVTPPWIIAPSGQVVAVRNGEQEHHIDADIAYAVWQYWQATADDDFLMHAGAEILIETARFWASRGRTEEDGRYHLRNVIGPDEYHENVDDNAYTNLLAQWNLATAVKAVALLQKRWPEVWQQLAARLALTAEEVQAWSRLVAITYTGLSSETNLFEQFAGYFDLAEIDLAAYEPRTVAMDVLLGPERLQQSKVVKQADVVMAMYLLWNQMSPTVRERNYRYYEARTGHGSSLSPPIHALVAARLNDLRLAEHYLHQTMEIDLANNMGNAAGGVHIGALGGLWQAVVFGFAGVQLREDGLLVDPKLPSQWKRLRIPLQWRKRRLLLDITQGPTAIEAELAGEDALRLTVEGETEVVMKAGRKYKVQKSGDTWSDWQEVSR
jgi:trehalose/maltose hydrolase-like predicted phosphorylase